MKHSPGKWEAECVGHGGPGDNPEEVWEVNNGHARIAEYMTEADARLVAAAPEMLEALKKARAWVAMYHNQPGHDAASRSMTDVIDRAIEKATQPNI